MSHDATTKTANLRDRLKDAGFSIRRFAIEHQFPISSAYAAATGDRDGVKTRRIRRQMERIANNAHTK